jgi:hypothetical protein
MRGPLVAIEEPARADEVVIRMKPEGADQALPAGIARTFGKGRVVYLAAAIDAGLWSYAYPYQRRLLTRAIEWAAREPAAVSVKAPMCVQATYFTQSTSKGRRTLIHLFNGVNTTANHGLPAADVPLREETIPVHNIEVTFHRDAPGRFRMEPGGKNLETRRHGEAVVVACPPLDLHSVLIAE